MPCPTVAQMLLVYCLLLLPLLKGLGGGEWREEAASAAAAALMYTRSVQAAPSHNNGRGDRNGGHLTTTTACVVCAGRWKRGALDAERRGAPSQAIRFGRIGRCSAVAPTTCVCGFSRNMCACVYACMCVYVCMSACVRVSVSWCLRVGVSGGIDAVGKPPLSISHVFCGMYEPNVGLVRTVDTQNHIRLHFLKASLLKSRKNIVNTYVRVILANPSHVHQPVH